MRKFFQMFSALILGFFMATASPALFGQSQGGMPPGKIVPGPARAHEKPAMFRLNLVDKIGIVDKIMLPIPKKEVLVLKVKDVKSMTKEELLKEQQELKLQKDLLKKRQETLPQIRKELEKRKALVRTRNPARGKSPANQKKRQQLEELRKKIILRRAALNPPNAPKKDPREMEKRKTEEKAIETEEENLTKEEKALEQAEGQPEESPTVVETVQETVIQEQAPEQPSEQPTEQPPSEDYDAAYQTPEQALQFQEQLVNEDQDQQKETEKELAEREEALKELLTMSEKPLAEKEEKELQEKLAAAEKAKKDQEAKTLKEKLEKFLKDKKAIEGARKNVSWEYFKLLPGKDSKPFEELKKLIGKTVRVKGGIIPGHIGKKTVFSPVKLPADPKVPAKLKLPIIVVESVTPAR